MTGDGVGPTLSGLTTPRLRLRPVTAADRDALERLNADQRVMRHIGPPLSIAQSNEFLHRVTHEASDQSGWFMVERRADDAAIGLAALKELSPKNLAAMAPLIAGRPPRELVEFGWRFAADYWGQGYATEIGRALVAFAFEQRELPYVNAVALIANEASCGAIQKCGLSPAGDYVIDDRHARWFRLAAEDWRRAHRPPAP